MTAGGATGKFTIDAVQPGDALGELNTQQDALHIGVDTSPLSGGPYLVHGAINAPFFDMLDSTPPQPEMSQGIYIGSGDQDNYVKLVLSVQADGGGILEVVAEQGGGDPPVNSYPAIDDLLGAAFIDLYFLIDPISGTIQPQAAANDGPVVAVGPAIPVTGVLLDVIQGRQPAAVGVISTSRDASPFIATWELLAVRQAANAQLGADQAAINFGRLEQAQTQTRTVRLINLGYGTGTAINITGISLSGSGAFTLTSVPEASAGSPLVLGPGETAELAVTFSPSEAGTQSAQIVVTHDGTNSPLEIDLSGLGGGQALYRVNAGGPFIADPNGDWAADLEGAPISYVNMSGAADNAASISRSIDMSGGPPWPAAGPLPDGTLGPIRRP